KRVRRLAESRATFSSATFTPDGRVVLVGAGGTIPAEGDRPAEEFAGELNLLDPAAGRWVRGFEVPPPAPSVSHRYTGWSALAPDGRTLYVSFNTGEVVGFEVATGRPRRALAGHGGFVGALAVSADGRRLISGGRDGVALVWDATLAGAAAPGGPPADPDQLWGAAAGGEPRAALAALGALATTPDRAVEVLRRHVKPAPAAPAAADIARIFAALDSPDFAAREKASAELTGYGES